MGKRSVFLGLVGLLCAIAWDPPRSAAADTDATPQLSEIVVTATLRAVPLSELPGSVSVLNSQTLRDAGQQNFEDVMGLVPNLNWAGDTSLPRYFQIRGVGELQQYQGAPNPSVGFLIDDIDFSGLGMAATLFDVDHIEVLRGPQGTLYGANALAGLIYVQKCRARRPLRRARGARRGGLRRALLRRGGDGPRTCARFSLQIRRPAVHERRLLSQCVSRSRYEQPQ